MPVYTFSTQTKRPSDDEVVKAVKKHCQEKRLNFSGLVVDLLRKHYEEGLKDGGVQR